jgi:hypothetical protein
LWVPVAALSRELVCGRLPAGIAGSNSVGGMDISIVSVVCSQVEFSVADWSLIQRPTECGVSECDRETSIMRRPSVTRGCCVIKKGPLLEANNLSASQEILSLLWKWKSCYSVRP